MSEFELDDFKLIICCQFRHGLPFVLTENIGGITSFHVAHTHTHTHTHKQTNSNTHTKTSTQSQTITNSISSTHTHTHTHTQTVKITNNQFTIHIYKDEKYLDIGHVLTFSIKQRLNTIR